MLFILASPPELAPNAGSEMVFDQPTVLFPVSVSFAGLSLGGRGRERKGIAMGEGRGREGKTDRVRGIDLQRGLLSRLRGGRRLDYHQRFPIFILRVWLLLKSRIEVG